MGTLWYGGKIYTMEKEGHTVGAIFVEYGTIVDVGEEDTLRRLYYDRIKKEVNLENGVMFPGFVDSHLHMIGHGETLLRLYLSEMTSEAQILDAIRERVKTTKKGEWIIGEGWNENNFVNKNIIHKKQLDEISTEHPIVITRVCRHALIANSYALKLAKIDEKTIDPQGGMIVKDENGNLTGYMLDQAQDLVKNAIPPVTDEYVTKALALSIEDMLKKGFVGGHTEDLHYYNGCGNTFQAFLNFIDGVEKKFRVNMLVHQEVVDELHGFGYQYGSVSPFVELGAMKIFADGSLGGRTALLREPYHDDPSTNGVAIQTLEQLKQLVKKARIYEMPVAIHTIGDLALEYALEAIEEFPVKFGLRDRIIHGQIVPDDLLARLKELPIVIDIQPRFVASDFPWVYEKLGKERAEKSYAWKTFIRNGVICAGGSDAPIEPIDPLLGIHAAVTRRKPSENHEGYNPKEKLSVYEAISLFTIGSALAISEESTRGKISKGYLADFTVFDRDLMNVQIEEILNAKVLKTVVDNTIMYERR